MRVFGAISVAMVGVMGVGGFCGIAQPTYTITVVDTGEPVANTRGVFVWNPSKSNVAGNTKVEDSLRRELLFYQVKEDYYSDALADQGLRYSLILGGLFLIAGFVGWATLYKPIQKRLKKTKQQFKTYQKDSDQIQIHVWKSTANFYSLLAGIANGEGRPADAIRWSILAAKWDIKAAEKERQLSIESDIVTTAINELGLPIACLHNLIHNRKTQAHFMTIDKFKLEEPEVQEGLNSDLRAIKAFRDTKLTELCDQITSLIDQYKRS